jgi:hypothetical protein
MELSYHVGWAVYNALMTLRFQHVNDLLPSRTALSQIRKLTTRLDD